MYKNILNSIQDVEWYAVVGLLLFITFFTAMLWRTWRMDRAEIDQVSRLPLNDTDPEAQP